MVYVNVVECLFKVIGEFNMVDIFIDFVLSCIFFNCVILCYLVFNEFYGMEEVIE